MRHPGLNLELPVTALALSSSLAHLKSAQGSRYVTPNEKETKNGCREASEDVKKQRMQD